MKNKTEAYNVAKELFKHKKEMLKFPNAFKELLEDLRKAVTDDEENDQDSGDDDYGDGYSVTDDPNSDSVGDEADQWLKENENKKPENKEELPQGAEKQKKQYQKEWEPQSEYSPEHKKAIDEHMSNGYTHRESERMAGAYKGPKDFVSAMRSGISPSMMSDKMHGDLKPLAKLFLEEADKREKLSANPEINPMKHAAGKMMEAHEKSTSNYSKAHSEFLDSDATKALKGRDRHQAVQAWKAEWKQKNPEHEAGLAEASNAQKTYGESKETAKQSLNERLDHIMSGGQSMPAEMSSAEAMQHLGGGKTEEGYQGSIAQDPSARFAANNPKLIASLKPEQQERLKRIDSAASSQGKVRVRKGGTPDADQ